MYEHVTRLTLTQATLSDAARAELEAHWRAEHEARDRAQAIEGAAGHMVAAAAALMVALAEPWPDPEIARAKGDYANALQELQDALGSNADV